METPESLVKSIEFFTRKLKLSPEDSKALTGIVRKAYEQGYSHGSSNRPYIVPLIPEPDVAAGE